MEDHRRICVVCCSFLPQFPPDDLFDSDTLNDPPWHDNNISSSCFHEFLRDLETVEGCHRGKNKKRRRIFSKDDVLTSLELNSDNVTICEACLHLISDVIEMKPQVTEVEKQVSRLQKGLLLELKRLHSLALEFQGKMEMIQKVVRESEVGDLKAVLKMDEKNRKCKRTVNDSSLGEDLLAFREKITEAVSELGKFMIELDNKTNFGGDQESRSLHWCVVPMETPVEINKKDLEIKEEPRQQDPSVVAPTENEVIDSMDDTFEDPSFPGDLESDSESEYRRIKPVKRKSKSVSRKTPKKPRKTPKRIIEPTPYFSHVNFDGMSKFKEEVIRAVIRMQRYKGVRQPSSKDLNEAIIPEDLTVEFRCPILYHPSRDQITIGDEAEVLVRENSLQCSLCDTSFSDAKNSAKVTLEKAYNHIAGKHLNGFQCGLCPKQFHSRKKYREHLSVHVNPCVCDICGKGLSGTEALGVHKWLHLNEEERAQALRDGKAPRYHQEKEKNLGKPPENFKCDICDKNFTNRPNLLKHVQRHNPLDTIICPKCGKEMKRSSYLVYHQKYACPMGSQAVNARRLTCMICNGTYQSKMSLRKHIERTHSTAATERPHICDICGKGYKTGSDMRYHAQTHSEDKQWKCDKCGKEFVMKRNLARHACPNGDKLKVRGSNVKMKPPPPEETVTPTLEVDATPDFFDDTLFL